MSKQDDKATPSGVQLSKPDRRAVLLEFQASLCDDLFDAGWKLDKAQAVAEELLAELEATATYEKARKGLSTAVKKAENQIHLLDAIQKFLKLTKPG